MSALYENGSTTSTSDNNIRRQGKKLSHRSEPLNNNYYYKPPPAIKTFSDHHIRQIFAQGYDKRGEQSE
jgi:hypothetical protein